MIIVTIGSDHNDRIGYCPQCQTWFKSNTDWNGAISSWREERWNAEPDVWIDTLIRSFVSASKAALNYKLAST
jgi:hypothetical protein